MLLHFLLFAQLLRPGAHTLATCVNNADARTPLRRSSAGFSVVLRMHSEDDHGKNTHLCQSDYSYDVIRPDGTSSPLDQPTGVDGAWGRRINFGLDGFLSDGNRVLGSFSEDDDHYPAFEVLIYDMRSMEFSSLDPPSSFMRRLGSACSATLHVTGTTAEGLVVIATSPEGGCQHAQQWQVRRGKRSSGRELPARPELLTRDPHVIALNPGTP